MNMLISSKVNVRLCDALEARLNWPQHPLDLSLQTLGRYSGLRLPTEWEWQWAATGGHQDYEYPWGVEWDRKKANTSESGLSRTTAVGLYPSGSAKCGAVDMSGNVWEWCLNEYGQLENIGLSGTAPRVLRGGSWHYHRDGMRASYRSGDKPRFRGNGSGFRMVVRPSSLSIADP